MQQSQEDGCDKGSHQSYLGTERNIAVAVIPNWFQPCQCCCCLCHPGEYFRLATLVSYKRVKVLEACDCLSCDSRATQPLGRAGCLCCHNTPNSDMDYGIFNVRTDVNTSDCTRGCTNTERDSALKVDSGKEIPCRTGESNLRQRRDGLMFYQ